MHHGQVCEAFKTQAANEATPHCITHWYMAHCAVSQRAHAWRCPFHWGKKLTRAIEHAKPNDVAERAAFEQEGLSNQAAIDEPMSIWGRAEGAQRTTSSWGNKDDLEARYWGAGFERAARTHTN